MKRLAIVFIVALSLTGCAALKQAAHLAVADYQLCKQDEVCWGKVKTDKDIISAAISTVGGIFIPAPAANAAGAASGAISCAILGWLFGRSKRKKSEAVLV